MGSVGFDGTLRKWDLKKMQMELLFQDRNSTGRDAVIQSIAWCRRPPPKGKPADFFDNLVVIGTSSGLIKLVDLQRNKILFQFALPKGDKNNTIFALDWNNDGLLAIGNTTEDIEIKRFGDDYKSFTDLVSITVHSESRCLQWNPVNNNILAAGLFNGNVIVFDTST